MNPKLIATVERRRSGARLIKLSGVLDEHNGLRELVEKVDAGTALINLAGVERINSIGARDWVNWLASLEARGIRPVLVACSPAVVAQLNRIKNFAGNGTIKSFQVPYRCTGCDQEKLNLVNVSDMKAPKLKPPECACESCGARMTVVDESGTYFAFLHQLRPTISAPEHDLARGSNASVTAEHLRGISSPRLSRGSRPSMSAFQLPDRRRQSEEEILIPPPLPSMNHRPYFIAVVMLLLCTAGVLAFLLTIV
jgi:anti-anti-sigma regulatory factor